MMGHLMPDIPRIYTAAAEWMACMLFIVSLKKRFEWWKSGLIMAGMLVLQSVFLVATGNVPIYFWIPCMIAAVSLMVGFIYFCCDVNFQDAGYFGMIAFVVAEFMASLEWQIVCTVWTNELPGKATKSIMLAAVYGAVFFLLWKLLQQHLPKDGKLNISFKEYFSAAVIVIAVFAVSNLSFISDNGVTMSVMSIFYIRTLVDMAGVLILTVQHEQLREAALHSELTAMDNVLRRQYEQYRQSKENIRLINRRYHELKMQIAAIRAERDRAKQDAALARMESGIRRYEAENKTGNPVLDTLLTAKSMDCQQRGINMTSVADGSQLGFLSTRELCTLVGAPLDNAIESVLAEPDPEKRLLRVAIYNQSGCVMLRFENYCAQPVEMGADGLPVHNAHGGYDLQGVQAAAQHHDGTMTLHWADGWFTLRILLPVPS